MATKPSWSMINPTSGSGNGSFAITAGEHTGREPMIGYTEVHGVGVKFDANEHQVKIIRTPKAEFVQFTEGLEMSAPKDGGAVTVTGKSNSSKLNFSTDASDITLPQKYTAAGLSTSNNVAISDDPGATAQYDFSIGLTLPSNPTTEEIERKLTVNANGGQTSEITIKQAAGEATLSLDKLEVTIPQEGGTVIINVTSNTTWTIQ